MTRAIRLRLLIFGTLGTLAAAGFSYAFVTNRAIDRRLNEELTFAYDNHLKTVHELVDYARNHAIEPAPALGGALTGGLPRPNSRDHRQFQKFESAQKIVNVAARELITTLDGDLDPEDGHLAKLIRRFDSEERSLLRIRDRFARAGFGWSRAALSP